MNIEHPATKLKIDPIPSFGYSASASENIQVSQEAAPSMKLKIVNDPVHHPHHYNAHPSGIECIQVTEHMNFCRGNAMKYLWRAGTKGDANTEIEDLRKAVWYLEREIQRLTEQLPRS